MKECNCHRGPEVGKKIVGCPPKVININHPAEPVLFHRVDVPAAMGDDITYPPENGLYKNVLLVYEANNHTYLYNSDGIPTNLSLDISELEERMDDAEGAIIILQDGVENLGLDLVAESGARKDADDALEQEIEDLKNSPDVVDIVATYADLQAYDTSALGDKDVIRVLADETHDGESTYYRWSKNAETWTFIGATGPYYTKNETDTLLGGKLGTDTTFWGQTINNGAVNGDIVFEGDLLTNGKGFRPANNGVEMIGGVAMLYLHGTNILDCVADFNMATVKNVADGSADVDAVNVRQLRRAIRTVSTADTPPTQNTEGVVGSLYAVVNSGEPEIYMCTAVTPVIPSGHTYTWQLVGPSIISSADWSALWS